jgi:tryptophanyl-tRNA synthetase
MNNFDEIDAALKIGAEKARLVAKDVLKRVREKVGY